MYTHVYPSKLKNSFHFISLLVFCLTDLSVSESMVFLVVLHKYIFASWLGADLVVSRDSAFYFITVDRLS